MPPSLSARTLFFHPHHANCTRLPLFPSYVFRNLVTIVQYIHIESMPSSMRSNWCTYTYILLLISYGERTFSTWFRLWDCSLTSKRYVTLKGRVIQDTTLFCYTLVCAMYRYDCICYKSTNMCPSQPQSLRFIMQIVNCAMVLGDSKVCVYSYTHVCCCVHCIYMESICIPQLEELRNITNPYKTYMYICVLAPLHWSYGAICNHMSGGLLCLSDYGVWSVSKLGALEQGTQVFRGILLKIGHMCSERGTMCALKYIPPLVIGSMCLEIHSITFDRGYVFWNRGYTFYH